MFYFLITEVGFYPAHYDGPIFFYRDADLSSTQLLSVLSGNGGGGEDSEDSGVAEGGDPQLPRGAHSLELNTTFAQWKSKGYFVNAEDALVSSIEKALLENKLGEYLDDYTQKYASGIQRNFEDNNVSIGETIRLFQRMQSVAHAPITGLLEFASAEGFIFDVAGAFWLDRSEELAFARRHSAMTTDFVIISHDEPASPEMLMNAAYMSAGSRTTFFGSKGIVVCWCEDALRSSDSAVSDYLGKILQYSTNGVAEDIDMRAALILAGFHVHVASYERTLLFPWMRLILPDEKVEDLDLRVFPLISDKPAESKAPSDWKFALGDEGSESDFDEGEGWGHFAFA